MLPILCGPEILTQIVSQQVKQVAIREKRKRHNELKGKAIAKKALKKLSVAEETRPAAPSKANLRRSPVSQSRPGKTPKKQKLENKTSTIKTRDASAKSTLRTNTPSDSKKSVPKSRTKSTRKASKPS